MSNGLDQHPSFKAWFLSSHKPYNSETDKRPRFSELIVYDGHTYIIEEGDYLDFLIEGVQKSIRAVEEMHKEDTKN